MPGAQAAGNVSINSPNEVRWPVGHVIAGLYQVERLLGSGGMGYVWLVRHLRWDCELVMKELQPAASADRTARRAFLAEAENWVNLPMHPNVVTAYYVRELEGALRIFAEYIDGEALDARIARGHLALPEILEIAIQCCAGLAHAHDSGLLHRDVKPDNVLLANTGAVKLMDFGLAKLLKAKDDLPAWEPPPGADGGEAFTARGGTPMYMSPEQQRLDRGARVVLTPAADISSFGVMLYEMLTGRRPQEGAQARQFVAEHRGEDNGLPAEILAVINRCLEIAPRQRWEDCHVLGERLREVYRQEIGQDTSLPRWPRIIPAADELNNRALSLLDLGKPQHARHCWQQALLHDPFHPQSTFNLNMPAWRRGEISDLEVVRQLEAVYEAADAQDWLSPYFLGLAQLERGERAGAGAALREAAARAPEELLVRRANEELQATDRQWSECRHVLEAHRGGVVAVGMSAEAKWVLSAGDDHTVKLWERATGRLLHAFSGHTHAVSAAALSAQGSWALSAGLDGTLRGWNLATGQCAWVVEGVHGVLTAALRADGLRAVTGGRDHSLWLWDMTTGQRLRQLTGHHGAVQAVAMSADGVWIASAGDDHTLRIWRASSRQSRFTFKGHTRAISCVAMSADGRRVVTGSWDSTLALLGSLLRALPAPVSRA